MAGEGPRQRRAELSFPRGSTGASPARNAPPRCRAEPGWGGNPGHPRAALGVRRVPEPAQPRRGEPPGTSTALPGVSGDPPGSGWGPPCPALGWGPRCCGRELAVPVFAAVRGPEPRGWGPADTTAGPWRAASHPRGSPPGPVAEAPPVPGHRLPAQPGRFPTVAGPVLAPGQREVAPKGSVRPTLLLADSGGRSPRHADVLAWGWGPGALWLL